jgi:hypothetical protein
MPRPTNLTPELQRVIAGYVNGGASIKNASVAAGVSWNTAKDWLARGKLGVEPYASFVAAMEQAKAAWIVAGNLRITTAGRQDWKATAWDFERRLREYAPPAQRIQMDVDIGEKVTAFLGRLQPLMSAGAYEEMLKALAVLHGGDAEEGSG